MVNGWDTLAAELDRWAAAGRVAACWWRDDDATEPDPALDRLLALAAGRPLTLAVIPAGAGPALAARLRADPQAAVVQHGYAHANHAPAGAKKCEFGADRPLAVMREELRQGYRRLADLFGPVLRPILAPPWNRIDAGLVTALPGLGFRGISTFGARGHFTALPGLLQVNCQVDPVDWRGTRGFAGERAVLESLVRELSVRRAGGGEEGPVGLLTHHRQHDRETWLFLQRLLQCTADHPALRWLSADEAFAADRR